ncbi:unnamed protein product [Rotaria sp. Silwood1]|nr:unnamed protein product [Rotaria sp. Silwood1]
MHMCNSSIECIFFKGLGLLSDILRVKNDRQPAIILKAITMESKDKMNARSILAELRDKADPSKKIIISLSQKLLDEFLMDVRQKQYLTLVQISFAIFFRFKAQNLGIVSIYYHLLIIGVDARQLNWAHFYESGVRLSSIQLVPNKSTHNYQIEQALIKDALDAIKYILRKLLFDNEYEKERLIPQQECSWKKLFTANSYTTFTQHIGETLLEISKTIKFLGATGIVDFDQAGLRRSIKLKVLDLSEHGMVEIGTWTNMNRLNINQLGFQQMSAIRKHLQVVTREEKPYVVRKVHINGSIYFEGYCIDMLDEIARRLQFNYSIRIAADAAYGKEDETGRWSGIIGELTRRTADLGIGALTITYPREQVIDFTKPFMTFGITILIRKPLRPPRNLFAFLAPLTREVWFFMAIAYIGVSLFLFSMARFSPYEWQSPYSCKRHTEYLINRFTIVNCFWFTIGSLMKQTIDYGPRSLSTRVLIGAWWFFSLIMIASYTANLAAFLTTKRLKSPIDDIEALAKQTEIKYGALKGGSTEQFFRSSKIPIYERMWYYMSSRPELFPETTEEGIEWVKNSKYAFLLESATNEYNVQRHCELMQVGGLIESKSYGIGTTHGSPYRDRISNEILQLQENGFLNNLYIKWWKERNLPERCDDSDVDHRKKSFTNELDLKNIGGVFVMLIIGLSFSFIVTSLEFYFKAKRRRLLDGKSTTIKERLKRDLHFALCTNCTSSRPTFIHEKDSIDKIENNNDEIFEDLNIKSNCIQNNPQETITSIDHERLTIVPLNHSPCHRIT